MMRPLLVSFALLCGTLLVLAHESVERERLIPLREDLGNIRRSLERLPALEAEFRQATDRTEKREMRLALLETEREAMQGTIDRLQDDIVRLSERLVPDTDDLTRDLLRPSAQLDGRTGIGAGIVLHSSLREDGRCETWVLTAHHVVKGVIRNVEGEEIRDSVTVRFTDKDGRPGPARRGDLTLHDAGRDLALVRVVEDGGPRFVARLAPRPMIGQIRTFTPIYAVGCPLGHAPLPSTGEITTRHKVVEGITFWMMNAPTIYGNSGGGVFHRETRELIGLSAMVCTFERDGENPVPHLGIMIPLDMIYDWLDEHRFTHLYDPNALRGDPLCLDPDPEAGEPASLSVSPLPAVAGPSPSR